MLRTQTTHGLLPLSRPERSTDQNRKKTTWPLEWEVKGINQLSCQLLSRTVRTLGSTPFTSMTLVRE